MTLTNAHAAFVFDHLEQERPEELYPAVFTIRADEVVELNPELARQLARVGPSAAAHVSLAITLAG